MLPLFVITEVERPLNAAMLPNFKCGLDTTLLKLPFVPLLCPTVDPESVVESCVSDDAGCGVMEAPQISFGIFGLRVLRT